MGIDEQIKQVIVMRNDLNMRKGKMIAQGAHAAVMAVMNDVDSRVIAWCQQGMKKICVRCDSEQELLDIVTKARNSGLIAELVRDAGLTEFGGVPTYTCAAIGPGSSSEIDKITGSLKLL
jgi:peptidyl-tRNA hydrolase, PTH2 family